VAAGIPRQQAPGTPRLRCPAAPREANPSPPRNAQAVRGKCEGAARMFLMSADMLRDDVDIFSMFRHAFSRAQRYR